MILKEWRTTVPLNDCVDLFPLLANRLSEINQALRNINFGKMDFLPYEEEVTGYRLTMRSDLIPQGVGKPPAMGKWQLQVERLDADYVLILQGKAKAGQELADVSFPCGDSPERKRFFPSTDGDT